MTGRAVVREIYDPGKSKGDPFDNISLSHPAIFMVEAALALAGDTENTVDFQVHTGPALGAFNQWVRGTDLEPWQITMNSGKERRSNRCREVHTGRVRLRD